MQGGGEGLLQRLRDGVPEALAELYDLTSRRAFGLAVRILRDEEAAADAVQEAYVAVWRQASRLDVRRGSVEGLVLTMVHHKSVDALRARLRRSGRTAALDFDVIDEQAASAFDVLAAALTRDEVLRALDALTAEQREVIDLAYFGGLTQQEIAERTGVPLGTVKSRMRLSMEKLRTAFGVTE
jgi:RNA polymerase sigma-70 factor (ECF subfamily)